MTKSRVALLCLGFGLFTASCEINPQAEEMEVALRSSSQKSTSLALTESPGLVALKSPSSFPALSENLRNLVINEAVAPSNCAPTTFAAIQSKYLNPFYSDNLGISYLNHYLTLNFYAAYTDKSTQYFGAEGEYTSLVTKRKRGLEQFWNMPNQIRVNGQHNKTLNTREKLADIYQLMGANVSTRNDALLAADQILSLNAASSNLPESPFFSSDGFATADGLIVMGDGLVRMISESGVDADIVWTGVLAHEWAHQIQFKNNSVWYSNGYSEDPATNTRFSELEADFMAAYYMTHKRGATFNWKRVEQFLTMFFQIGDCGFNNASHHGTPAQRMAAAQLGYTLAQEAQKQGHILTQKQAHDAFVSRISRIL